MRQRSSITSKATGALIELIRVLRPASVLHKVKNSARKYLLKKLRNVTFLPTSCTGQRWGLALRWRLRGPLRDESDLAGRPVHGPLFAPIIGCGAKPCRFGNLAVDISCPLPHVINPKSEVFFENMGAKEGSVEGNPSIFMSYARARS
jgi:hypothetical protein